jgi:hypothetical protein
LSKFLLEPSAAMSLGNTCAGCNTHKHDDGFVNTNFDVLGRGRLYFCAGCVWEMGRVVGCLDPQQAQILRDSCDEIAAASERMADELQATKENMVVPLAEVIDFLKERETRRPNEPAPASVA